jgi:hypothetical protein
VSWPLFCSLPRSIINYFRTISPTVSLSIRVKERHRLRSDKLLADILFSLTDAQHLLSKGHVRVYGKHIFPFSKFSCIIIIHLGHLIFQDTNLAISITAENVCGLGTVPTKQFLLIKHRILMVILTSLRMLRIIWMRIVWCSPPSYQMSI